MSFVSNESIYAYFNVKWQMMTCSWERATERKTNDNSKEKQLINLERCAAESN